MMRLVVGTLLGLATTTSVIAAPPGSSFGIAHKATCEASTATISQRRQQGSPAPSCSAPASCSAPSHPPAG
jgi:hypothetical protein